jgi:hypothetical protein
MENQTMQEYFHRYGDTCKYISEKELFETAGKLSLFPRIENSGCEANYIEIAALDKKAWQYKRYAFCKFWSNEAENAKIFCVNLLEAANLDEHDPLIHYLPNFTEETEETLKKSSHYQVGKKLILTLGDMPGQEISDLRAACIDAIADILHFAADERLDPWMIIFHTRNRLLTERNNLK